MSSERKPTTDHSVLTQPIVLLTRFSVRYPVSVLALGIALAVCGVFAAMGNLGFKTNRLDLISPSSSYNQLWLEYIEEFGEPNDIIVVVEGESSAEVAPVLDELSEKILAHRHTFQSVLHGIDVSKIREKGLHYIPVEDLKKIESFTADVHRITEENWNLLNIDHYLDMLRARLVHPEQVLQQLGKDPQSVSPEQFRQITLHELDLLAQSLNQAFANKPVYGSPWPQLVGYPGTPDVVTACSQSDTGYFIVPGDEEESAMGFALVRIAEEEKKEVQSFANQTEPIETLRTLITEMRGKYPELQIGLTGLPVMENDEMQLSQEAMGRASLLAFFGVVCVFFAGMGGLRHPILANIALMIGFGWTAGYILLSVGHLNILSIAFSAILIGLGSDFSVHYISRYLQLRQSIRSPSEAILQTAHTVGPGVVTGATTTAIAFLMAGFTDFTGIVELGIISGGGIMLCCLGTILLIPALLQLSDGSRPMRKVSAPVNTIGWIEPILRFPKFAMFLIFLFTAFLFTGIPKVWYDHNLLNLQPEGLESVELEKKLLSTGGQNAWFALSIADNREELLFRKEQFAKKYPELQVEEIVSMIPWGSEDKSPMIRRISESLLNLPERPPLIPISYPDEVGQSIAQLQNVLGKDPYSQQISRNLNQVRQSLRSMSESDCLKRMQDYQNAIAGDLLSRLHILRAMANPEPPELSDLPEPLVSHYFSRKNGKHLMRIYTNTDIWNMEEMKEFVRKVRDVDPKATGSPLQTYEASLQMQKGYQQAGVYALFAIVFLIFFDFRSLKYTILAMVPMLIGMGQTLGIMGLLNIPLNPANTILIPLILGIGVDYGVHVMHDFRSQSGPYRLNASTASAVLITSLTTIIGFGSLMIASHRGLQSLGRVLVIGMGCTIFCSIVLLPAFLTWWTRKRKSSEEKTPEESGQKKSVRDLIASFEETPFPLSRMEPGSNVPSEPHFAPSHEPESNPEPSEIGVEIALGEPETELFTVSEYSQDTQSGWEFLQNTTPESDATAYAVNFAASPEFESLSPGYAEHDTECFTISPPRKDERMKTAPVSQKAPLERNSGGRESSTPSRLVPRSHGETGSYEDFQQEIPAPHFSPDMYGDSEESGPRPDSSPLSRSKRLRRRNVA